MVPNFNLHESNAVIPTKIGTLSKVNQNSRSKIGQKQKHGGIVYSGSILKTTKAQNNVLKRGQGAASTSHHSIERKENINHGNCNRIQGAALRESNQGSSVVAFKANGPNLRSLHQQNSNNLNVRRNFGSNDSFANAAPHQKKYALANKFQQSKSNSKVNVLKT
jgi:hypothetical protein